MKDSIHNRDLGLRATSTDYHVDVNAEADVNVANLIAADEPMNHTVVGTSFLKVQDCCVVVTFVFPPL